MQESIDIPVFFKMLIKPLEEIEKLINNKSYKEAFLEICLIKQNLQQKDWKPFSHYNEIKDMLDMENIIEVIEISMGTLGGDWFSPLLHFSDKDMENLKKLVGNKFPKVQIDLQKVDYKKFLFEPLEIVSICDELKKASNSDSTTSILYNKLILALKVCMAMRVQHRRYMCDNLNKLKAYAHLLNLLESLYAEKTQFTNAQSLASFYLSGYDATTTYKPFSTCRSHIVWCKEVKTPYEIIESPKYVAFLSMAECMSNKAFQVSIQYLLNDMNTVFNTSFDSQINLLEDISNQFGRVGKIDNILAKKDSFNFKSLIIATNNYKYGYQDFINSLNAEKEENTLSLTS